MTFIVRQRASDARQYPQITLAAASSRFSTARSIGRTPRIHFFSSLSGFEVGPESLQKITYRRKNV